MTNHLVRIKQFVERCVYAQPSYIVYGSGIHGHVVSESQNTEMRDLCNPAVKEATVALENKTLWDSFNALNTEMIVTKSGR